MHDANASTETTATQSMSEEESSLMRRRAELMRERLAAQLLVNQLYLFRACGYVIVFIGTVGESSDCRLHTRFCH